MLTIYGKNSCSWCEKAKELAESRNIQYEYLNVDEDPQHLITLHEIKPDAKSVPQIWWHGRYIGGYNNLIEEIENTIGGYGDGKI